MLLYIRRDHVFTSSSEESTVHSVHVGGVDDGANGLVEGGDDRGMDGQVLVRRGDVIRASPEVAEKRSLHFR